MCYPIRDRYFPLEGAVDFTLKDESPIFAAIDIGTNSIRLAVVRSEASQGFTTLAQHREVVRLGEGEFDTNQMTPDAIKRGALVCAKFAEVGTGLRCEGDYRFCDLCYP